MSSLLFIAAHPALELSRTNGYLTSAADDIPSVTVSRLYDMYPDFHIDVAHEHDLLMKHQHIVFQYPLYWYMPPPLLKEWMDQVLSPGFAFGDGGDALEGKHLMLSLTVGASEGSYHDGGYQGHSMDTFLSGMKQTAHFCGMRFLEPIVMYDSQKASSAAIDAHASLLIKRVKSLVHGDTL